MPSPLPQRVIAANAYRVPQPFKAFAVRSDEPAHAFDARAPYDRVHVVRAGFLNADALASMAAPGRARTTAEAFSDIDYATTTLQELAAAAPGVADLAGSLAAALQVTGVLGDEPDAYRSSLAARIDGRIGEIPVARGQDIAAHAVLVRIDNPETIAKREQAVAVLELARRSLPQPGFAA